MEIRFGFNSLAYLEDHEATRSLRSKADMENELASMRPSLAQLNERQGMESARSDLVFVISAETEPITAHAKIQPVTVAVSAEIEPIAVKNIDE